MSGGHDRRWRQRNSSLDEVGGLAVKLAEFADARPVAQDGALGDGQQAQIVEEAI